jgi:hypothetical protein
VLPQLRPDGFQQPPGVPDHREVAENGMISTPGAAGTTFGAP